MQKAKKEKGGNHLKKDISMLALLANQRTSDCRKFLQSIGETDAKNHLDLELKLAEVYKAAPDKISIEKSFANLHPHKDFILKHCKPEPKIEPEVITIENPDLTEAAEQSNNSVVSENYHGCCGMSSASGESNCNCSSCKEKKSNACGCGGSSSFSGADENKKTEKNIDLTIIGLVSVVALFGMVMIMKK